MRFVSLDAPEESHGLEGLWTSLGQEKMESKWERNIVHVCVCVCACAHSQHLKTARKRPCHWGRSLALTGWVAGRRAMPAAHTLGAEPLSPDLRSRFAHFTALHPLALASRQALHPPGRLLSSLSGWGRQYLVL